MKLSILLISFFYSFYINAQDARDALPITLREKTDLQIQNKKLSLESSQILVKHLNDLSSKYEDKESLRSLHKRAINVARNVIPLNTIGIKALSELTFETTDWWFDNQTKKNQDEFNYNLDNLAKAIITNNVKNDINSEKFRNDIKALFFDANIQPEHYPVLGRQFDQMIFNHIAKNTKDLESFKTDISSKIETLERSGLSKDKAIQEIQNTLIKSDGQTQTLKDTQEIIRNNLAQLELNVDTKLNSFIKGTTKWQEKVNDDIDFIGDKIKKNEELIKINTNIINDLRKQINSNSLSIEEQSKKLKELQSFEFKNRDLVILNRVRIDAIGTVLYGEASTSGKIEMLKKGLIKFDSDKEKKEEIEKIENLQSWENFNRDLALGHEIVQFASNLGLDKKTTKDASKAIKTLSIVGQFAMSYPSNPMGMLSSINGAFSLFGGGSDAGPDPEIMKELAAIKKSLNEINQKVDLLNEKNDTLIARQYKFHRKNMEQFSSLHREIKELEIKTDYIMQLISNVCTILDQDKYSSIDTIRARLTNKNIPLSDYNDQLMSFPFLLPSILSCVEDNTHSLNLSALPFIHMNRVSPEIVKEQYNYCLIYAKSFYNQNYLINGMNYLPISTNSIWQTITTNSSIDIDTANAFSQMINPKDLTQLINLYIAVMPYFILKKNADNNNYTIWSEEEIKKVKKQIISDRTETNLNNLKRLNSLIDYALIQQNLLSGNKLFDHLNNDLGKSSTDKSSAFLAIKNNKIMQLNLATYIINENITTDFMSQTKFIDFINRSYNEKLSNVEIDSWSKRLKNNWVFEQKETNTGHILNITTIIQYNGQNEKIQLPLDLESILTNEVIYTYDTLELLNSREILKEKLYEYEFQSILNKQPINIFTKEFNNLYH